MHPPLGLFRLLGLHQPPYGVWTWPWTVHEGARWRVALTWEAQRIAFLRMNDPMEAVNGRWSRTQAVLISGPEPGWLTMTIDDGTPCIVADTPEALEPWLGPWLDGMVDRATFEPTGGAPDPQAYRL